MSLNSKTFLVTGGAGYIGTVLSEWLLSLGHEVICLDRCFFGEEKISGFINHPNYRLIKEDIRNFDSKHFNGVDVVVDMASLSNDPVGELDEEKTYAINTEGRLRVCRLAKNAGVSRYILTSSCSVYGFNDGICEEASTPRPLTTYAKCNSLAEACLEMAAADFSVTILRLATVFGLSKRMRFDLVINTMVLSAFRDRSICVCGDGKQYRPFIHVKDVARAIAEVAASTPEEVSFQIYNVGFNRNNHSIRELADIIQKVLPVQVKVLISGDQPDTRSYQVNFDKYMKTFGTKPEMSLAAGALEVWEALEKGYIFDALDTITVKWYKHLIEAQRLMRSVELKGEIL